MSSSLSSSRRARARAIPLVFGLHVLFAATALFSPRVVLAVGEDAVSTASHDDTGNNAEQGELQSGGATLAWAAKTVETAVGSVEKTVRDAVSVILQAEEMNTNHEKEEEEEEVQEEERVDSVSEAVAGVTAAAAAEEDSDSHIHLVDSHVDEEQDGTTDETTTEMRADADLSLIHI